MAEANGSGCSTATCTSPTTRNSLLTPCGQGGSRTSSPGPPPMRGASAASIESSRWGSPTATATLPDTVWELPSGPGSGDGGAATELTFGPATPPSPARNRSVRPIALFLLVALAAFLAAGPVRFHHIGQRPGRGFPDQADDAAAGRPPRRPGVDRLDRPVGHLAHSPSRPHRRPGRLITGRRVVLAGPEAGRHH